MNPEPSAKKDRLVSALERPAVRAVALGLLTAATATLAVSSLVRKSVTFDEYASHPHGYALWMTDAWHIDNGVPPLPKMLGALPLLIQRPRFDLSEVSGLRTSWQCGNRFARANADDYQRYFVSGRCVSVLVLLATCWMTVALARRLHGPTGGWIAAPFVFFCPNLIAHGRLVTADIHLTAAVVAALWAFDCFVKRPGWKTALALGGAMGVAALCKFTGVLLFVGAPLAGAALWVWAAVGRHGTHGTDGTHGTHGTHGTNGTDGAQLADVTDGAHATDETGDIGEPADSSRERRRLDLSPLPHASHPSHESHRSLSSSAPLPDCHVGLAGWGWGAVAVLVGLLAIHLGYGFDGSFTLLRDFRFDTTFFQNPQALLPGWLPIPFPHYFFKGVDTQLAEPPYATYLMGEPGLHGWPHYFLVALLVKTPTPTLVLVVLAAVAGGRLRPRELPALVIGLGALAYLSLAGHKQTGVRYVLFLYPVMAVWIARLGPRLESVSGRGAWGARLTVGAGAVWIFAAALFAWPHYLSYFNLPSGGPANGHRYLLDSNLDWGQDLIGLRRFVEREGIDRIDLAYAGRTRPELYGIPYRTLGDGPPGRFVAISANLLWGRMYFVNGTSRWPEDPDTYAGFRALAPRAVIGHTIYVYDLRSLRR